MGIPTLPLSGKQRSKFQAIFFGIFGSEVTMDMDI